MEGGREAKGEREWGKSGEEGRKEGRKRRGGGREEARGGEGNCENLRIPMFF